MNKDVEVIIKGRQYNQEETLTTKSFGQYYFKDGKHFVTYEEVSEDRDVSKCLLKFDTVSLEHTKKGDLTVRFLFTKGTKHQTVYNTPFGDFLMGINTKEYSVKIEEDKINLHAIYDMEINDEFASENEIIIEVKSI